MPNMAAIMSKKPAGQIPAVQRQNEKKVAGHSPVPLNVQDDQRRLAEVGTYSRNDACAQCPSKTVAHALSFDCFFLPAKVECFEGQDKNIQGRFEKSAKASGKANRVIAEKTSDRDQEARCIA